MTEYSIAVKSVMVNWGMSDQLKIAILICNLIWRLKLQTSNVELVVNL